MIKQQMNKIIPIRTIRTMMLIRDIVASPFSTTVPLRSGNSKCDMVYIHGTLYANLRPVQLRRPQNTSPAYSSI